MRNKWFAMAILVAGFGTACSGDKDEGKEPVSGSAPEILSFAVSPASIQAGEKVSLAWATEGATSVAIADDHGAPVDTAGALSGSVELSPDHTTTWTLVAKNGHGETKATAKVSVGTGDAPTIEFSASNTKVSFDDASELTWTVQGADWIVVRAGEEVLVEKTTNLSGSLEVKPHDTTTYVLEASGPGGDASAQVKIEVAPAVASFRTNATGPVAKGTLLTLSWETAGAESIVLSNLDGWETTVEAGSIDEGSVQAPVGAEGIFRLTATRAGIDVSVKATVAVMGAPVIDSFTAAPENFDAAVGANVNLAWRVTGASRLDLQIDGAVETVELPMLVEGFHEIEVSGTTTFKLIASNGDATSSAEAKVTGWAAPAIVSFTTSHELVGATDPFTLYWETANADQVILELDGEVIADDLAAAGSLAQDLSVSGNYTLRAKNVLPNGVTSSIAITVSAPEIGSFEASSEVGAPGDAISFTWTTVGATAVRVVSSGGTEVCAAEEPAQLAAGSCDGIVPEDAEGFSLVATNGSGDSTRDVEFDATSGPVIREFAVTPSVASVGATVTVSWDVDRDASGAIPTLSLVDGDGTGYPLGAADPEHGSVDIQFDTAGTYALTLTASTDGTEDAVATRPLQVVELPQVTATVSPATVGIGLPAIISWQAQHAVAVRVHALDGAGTPVNQVFISTNAVVANGGSTTVQPFTTTSYRVTVENAAGATATDDVQVEVEAAGIMDFSTATPVVSAGTTVTLDWITAGGTVSISGMVEIPAANSPYVDISATGILLEQDGCDLDYPYDEGCVDFTVQGTGFFFPFEGIDRDYGRAYTNGFISFDQGPGILDTSLPGAIPSTSSPFVHLAPFWSNLLIVPDGVPGMGIYGELRDQGPGEPHVIVAWNQAINTILYVYDFWSEMNFEVVAFASGSFEYRYGTMWAEIIQEWADGEDATIGFQDSTGMSGFMLNPGQLEVPGGLSDRSFRAERNAPATGSLEVVVRQTTTYELCLDDGVAPICQNLTVTVN